MTMSNYHWWRGRFSEPAERLSILDLVNFGTLDLKLASILWLIMERRASVLVAAGPSNAGKSTLLSALLDFLPPEVTQTHIGNRAEDFRFSEHSLPADTYMVAAEINSYGFYLWGAAARKAFELLSHGYGLGSTMHARTVEEALGILHYELGLPLSLIVHLDAVVTIRLTGSWNYDTEPERRVEAVGLIDSEKDELSIQVISARNSENGKLDFASEGDLEAALYKKFKIKHDQIGPEIQLRERFLADLLAKNRYSSEEVRKAVVEFYRDRPS